MNKRLRAGIYQWYIPHYRLGVFEFISNKNNMECTVLSPLSWGGFEINPDNLKFPFKEITSFRFKIPGTKNYLTFQPRAVWDMVFNKYDVIMQPNDILGLDVWINAIISLLLKRKLCLWGMGMSRPQTGIRTFLRYILMSMSSSVIFYTEGIQEYWINKGLDPKKLFVAYNSMDTQQSEYFRSNITQNSLHTFMTTNGLDGHQIVLFVGRLQERKRPDLFIKAIHEVRKSIPNVKGVIIGDGIMRPALEQLVKKNLNSSVYLKGEIYSEETLAMYFMAAKIAVIPAAAGLGIQHAFGYAVPIVIGDNFDSHGPEAELVVHGHTGLYCRDGNVSEFSQAIKLLLADDSLRRKMGEEAYKIIKTKYNTEGMAEGLCKGIFYC